MAATGGSKAFMLDKYFYELQRFWDTEWNLNSQGRSQEETTVNAHDTPTANTLESTAAHWTAYGRPKGRPQPITGTPTFDVQLQLPKPKPADISLDIFGVNLEQPPPVPPSRSYTVSGNSKLGFPQTRIMKTDFPSTSDFDVTSSSNSDGGTVRLRKGEAVTVIGASTRRGHLLVEHHGHQFHVPYQYMQLPVTTLTAASIQDIRSCTSRRARSAVSSLSTGSHKRNKPASVIGHSVVSR